MKKTPIVVATLLAILGWAMSLYAADSESFTGTAARSGTFKRLLLDVNGKRYELRPSDQAQPSVTNLLKKFSEGETGRYVIRGTRGTVKGNDGIIIDSITPVIAAARTKTRLCGKTLRLRRRAYLRQFSLTSTQQITGLT